jgi:hypothetical protein
MLIHLMVEINDNEQHEKQDPQFNRTISEGVEKWIIK